jgi:arylsulfatase A-like enzyme
MSIRRLFSVLLALAPGVLAADRPNVLLVVTDDQRFDTIAALGNREIVTPTLDGLVRRGAVFSNAYGQGSMVPAVCAPSRTMLLTGRSLFRIPAPNAKSYSGPTLGGTFRSAGYRTLCLSKPGNSFRVGHDAFENVVHIPHVGADTNRRCAEGAIEFLKNETDRRPWFIYFAPSMPHDPRTAEAEFHAAYDPARLTLSANFMPRHPFDNGELAVRDEKLAAFPRDPAEMRRHLADYYACISSFDHHLGRILDAIRARRELERTLIVVTSDQGLAVGGRHGLMGKQNLYEHVKPPLIIAGPGIRTMRSDALVYLFDLYPTLCELAGVVRPEGLEGASLVPVLKGEKEGVRERLFAAYRNVQRMVRDRRWKLIRYPKIGRTQLFDLERDPDELHDLSASHPAEVARLETLLNAERERWSDPHPMRP